MLVVFSKPKHFFKKQKFLQKKKMTEIIATLFIVDYTQNMIHNSYIDIYQRQTNTYMSKIVLYRLLTNIKECILHMYKTDSLFTIIPSSSQGPALSGNGHEFPKIFPSFLKEKRKKYHSYFIHFDDNIFIRFSFHYMGMV